MRQTAFYEELWPCNSIIFKEIKKNKPYPAQIYESGLAGWGFVCLFCLGEVVCLFHCSFLVWGFCCLFKNVANLKVQGVQ